MKKRRTLLFCLGILIALFLFPASTLGAEKEASDRETQVGFVKGDPLPGTSDSEKPTNGVKQKPIGRLPSTGEKITSIFVGIGVIALLICLIVYKKSHKKVGKKE